MHLIKNTILLLFALYSSSAFSAYFAFEADWFQHLYTESEANAYCSSIARTSPFRVLVVGDIKYRCEVFNGGADDDPCYDVAGASWNQESQSCEAPDESFDSCVESIESSGGNGSYTVDLDTGEATCHIGEPFGASGQSLSVIHI